MPALSALPNQYEPSLSCFIAAGQAWSTLTLLIAVAFLLTVAIAIASRRRHWPRHPPAAAPPPSMKRARSSLHNNWRQASLARSSSAAEPVPSLPVPTIRRSSYPPARGGRPALTTKPGRKERISTEYDLGVGIITRRDTIELIRGCRRHTLVLGRMEDAKRDPWL